MSLKTGNKNLSNEEKLPPECYRVDALDYDHYADDDEEVPYKTREQQLQILEQWDNKRSCPRKLDEVYPNTEVTTPEKLEQQIKQFEETEKQMGSSEYCESENPSNCTKKQQGGSNHELEK